MDVAYPGVPLHGKPRPSTGSTRHDPASVRGLVLIGRGDWRPSSPGLGGGDGAGSPLAASTAPGWSRAVGRGPEGRYTRGVIRSRAWAAPRIEPLGLVLRRSR